MTLIERLKQYNAWRRGDELDMPDPKQIGEDIDAAIKRIAELKAELAESQRLHDAGGTREAGLLARIAAANRLAETLSRGWMPTDVREALAAYNQTPRRKDRMVSEKSCEQLVREMMDRAGVPDAANYTAGDLTELANHVADARRYRKRIAELEAELAEAKALRDELTDEAHAAELAALAAAIKDASDDR